MPQWPSNFVVGTNHGWPLAQLSMEEMVDVTLIEDGDASFAYVGPPLRDAEAA